MNLSKREKIFIFIALFVAVIGLYYLLFLKPYTKDMVELNSQILSSEAEVSAGEQRVATHTAMTKMIDENNAVISELSAGITSGWDQPPMLVYLADRVTSHGIKGAFNFGEVRQSEYLYVSPVTVTMLASYDELKKLLAEFAEGEHFVRITRISIETYNPDKSEAEEEIPQTSNLVEVSLDIEFYNMIGEIDPGTVYEFANNHKYDADLFKKALQPTELP